MLKQNVSASIFFLLLLIAAGAAAYGQMPGDMEEPEVGENETGDGFRGTARGFGGELTVYVRVDGGKIEAIEILEHSETESIAEPAFEELTRMIIEKQSTEVDVVSGATETSTAFIRAVRRALEEDEGS